jgi:hypothetical protein
MNASSKTALSLYISPFTTEKFTEIIDWKIVIKMLLSNTILKNTIVINKKSGKKFEYENERTQFIELLKKGCKFAKTRKEIDKAVETNTLQTADILPKLFHNTEKYLTDKLEVKYFYDKKKTIGRVFPAHSLSLCNFRRPIRHILAYKYYLDIDIVNCHFKIADEIFNKEKIQFPLLHDYVVRREHYLQYLCDYFNKDDVMEYTGKKPLNIVDDYDLLKECFLIQLYYGTWEGWRDDNMLPPLKIPQLLIDFKAEFDVIADIIKTSLPDWVEMANSLNKTDNLNGTIVSWFLQEWERRILEVIKKSLKTQKQVNKNNCVLCFDGIMPELTETNKEKSFQDKINKEIANIVNKELGIMIELKVKPFDRMDYKEELEAIEVADFDDNMIIIDDKDDKAAASIIYDRLLKDKLYYCKGCYYLKTENKWMCELKSVQNQLLQMILDSNIYTQTISSKELKCYCQSVNNAKNVMTAILAYVATIPNDALYNKFHDSTRGKICFLDGVLFLEEKEFRLWESPYFDEPKNEIYTTIIINRKFNDVFQNRNSDKSKEIIADIKTKLFETILGSQSNTMLQQFSRAIGGYYMDKDWGLWIGERNCGKGCINELLVTAFEKYVTNLPSNCLLHSKFANKDTKEHSWMIDLQYPRITLVQEFKKDSEKQSNVIVDGVAIKSICSGGDVQKSRKNYQDEMEFVVGTKIFVMCNDLPKIEPQDCLETCIQYNSGKQFKSKKFIENRKAEIEKQIKDEEIVDETKIQSIMGELNKYLEADDKMKDICKSKEWGDAFVILLMENFVTTKLEPSNDSDLKEDGNADDIINKWFLFTKNESDVLTNEQLKAINKELPLKLSFQKLKNILTARGCCEYRTGQKRGLRYIREIVQVEVVKEDTK